MSHLFTHLNLRELTFRNRIFVSPMCQYSSDAGLPTDWHLVHVGSRAVGGAALVMVEASAVSPEGRISPWDSGMWSPQHARAFARITKFIREQGAVPAIQLAHAGRKASTDRPWNGGKAVAPEKGGWEPIGPSATAFDEGYPMPRQMSERDIDAVVDQFKNATRYSFDAGFEAVQVHMAHGYLLHEFLSPLTNKRSDAYGGSLENRMRFPLRVARAVRESWPAKWPVFVRISASDWAEGGWTIRDSVTLGRELKKVGVDLIDCSSGGAIPRARIEVGPGYQVPFAATIRKEVGIATGAVGMITDPKQAEEIIASGKADVVLLAREMLRDPYWPLHAAEALGDDIAWPIQYGRAKPVSARR
jgi:2,4-dienoyl-CoA reductase-like NADH-dependent reductase (Old Yellow Enzyme family)